MHAARGARLAPLTHGAERSTDPEKLTRALGVEVINPEGAGVTASSRRGNEPQPTARRGQGLRMKGRILGRKMAGGSG